MRHRAGPPCIALLLMATIAVGLSAQAPIASDSTARLSAVAPHATRDAGHDAPPVENADRRFAEAMLPHHMAAIEMARAELLRGTDPEMRRLAQEIIVDQQSEIDALSRWLRRTSTAPAPVTPAP